MRKGDGGPRSTSIRPCVGATYCLDRIYEGGEALCIHNAATGREATMPHVIARSDGPPKKVVVVGAGPAGLEAARVAAERGHAVIVLEAAAQAGGQVRLAAQNPRRKELIGIVDWRAGRTASGSASRSRYDVWAEADDVLALAPDVVVVATGGLPQNPPLDDGRRTRHLELGHPRRARQAGRERAALRRQWRPSRHERRRS